MRAPLGPSPLLALGLALVVLVGGIAAALTRDDSTSARTAPGSGSTTRPSIATTASTSTTAATFNTLPPTTLATTSTTVRPAVPTPEAAANGLWSAYSGENRSAAARFASPEVVDALFSTPFSGEEVTFQGCRKQGQTVFECGYQQTSAQYTMIAEADTAGSFKIVQITIAG